MCIMGTHMHVNVCRCICVHVCFLSSLPYEFFLFFAVLTEITSWGGMGPKLLFWVLGWIVRWLLLGGGGSSHRRLCLSHPVLRAPWQLCLLCRDPGLPGGVHFGGAEPVRGGAGLHHAPGFGSEGQLPHRGEPGDQRRWPAVPEIWFSAWDCPGPGSGEPEPLLCVQVQSRSQGHRPGTWCPGASFRALPASSQLSVRSQGLSAPHPVPSG